MTIELDRLKSLASFAEQICNMADNEDDARRQINHLIARTEQEIKTKSLEIQLQQSHIALLRHLDGFLGGSVDKSGQVRLSETEGAPPRVLGPNGAGKPMN